MSRKIIWPDSNEVGRRHLLAFQVNVIEELGLAFPQELPNPLATGRRFLEGAIFVTEYEGVRDAWWGYIDRLGITDFRSREALVARVAICLLTSTSTGHDALDEHLDWYFEVLHKLGLDTEPAFRRCATHFERAP